jgi:hypothetical protein
MHNKVVLSVLQNVLSVREKSLTSKSNFRSMGASPSELNWVLFETERRLNVQLPERAISQDSTIKDLLKTVVTADNSVCVR